VKSETKTEPKPCPYRKEHEWDDKGMCLHCYAVRPSPEPEPYVLPMVPFPTTHAPTSAVGASGQQTFTGSVTVNGQTFTVDFPTGWDVSSHYAQKARVMPLQKLSWLQAAQAFGAKGLDEQIAQLIDEAVTPYTKETLQAEAMAAAAREALRACCTRTGHDFDEREGIPEEDEFGWCRRCKEWSTR
jgi:hypothetical protein